MSAAPAAGAESEFWYIRLSCLSIFRVVRAIREPGEHEENFDQPNQNDDDEEDKYEVAHQIEVFRHFHSLVQLEI